MFADAVWLKNLLRELGYNSTESVRLLCDNKAALQIAKNPMYHKRPKHVELDCHFIRERILDGTIIVFYVATKEQVDDLLTKALRRQQHEFLLNQYGIKDVFRDTAAVEDQRIR